MRQQLSIVFTLFTCLAFGQKQWSLQECINYALENNLTIKDYQLTTASNKENQKQAVRNLLPGVSGSANYSITYGRSVDPRTNQFINTSFFSNNYSLNSSLDLFRGFQKQNQIRAAKFLYKATKEDESQQKFLLAFRVMNAYYDIQFFEGKLTIAKDQVKVSKSNYELIKKQVQLGTKAGADLYESESNLLKDELEVVKSENQLEAAKLKLMQEMNKTDGERIEIVINETKSVAVNLENTDKVFESAEQAVPLLKSQQMRVAAAQKQLEAQRGNYYPYLQLFASYGTGFFETNIDNKTKKIIPFGKQINDNASQQIGISLNIPIFNRGNARSRVAQQKIEWMKAQNNLNVQKQVLYQEIQKLVQENNSLKKELSQTEKQTISQEQAFKIAQKKYRNGLISIMELNQAKNAFATAKNNQLQTILKLKVNTSTLDFYKGISTYGL